MFHRITPMSRVSGSLTINIVWLTLPVYPALFWNLKYYIYIYIYIYTHTHTHKHREKEGAWKFM